MQRYLPLMIALVGAAGCAPGYTRADVVYAEPAHYVYVVPVDRVVVVTQEVLVTRGWTVYRVQRAGPNRIIWARRGDDVVRIFANPEGRGERVVVRGLQESRAAGKHDDKDARREDDDHDRGRHRGWESHGQPNDIISDIDVRLRANR
jgi:hypothetical protein